MVKPRPEPQDWVADVLGGLHATPTVGNTNVLRLWAASEGMPAGTYNWLAATDKRKGSRNYNKAGVQEYPSYRVGVEVVVTKLSGKLYGDIGAALVAGDARAAYEAINTSPWCKGCQGGEYPVAVLRWIEAGQDPGTTNPQPPGGGPTRQTGATPDSWGDQVSAVASSQHSAGVSLSGTGDALASLLR